jgi:SPP1 gp7 family putative phage head morphogenesis protein
VAADSAAATALIGEVAVSFDNTDYEIQKSGVYGERYDKKPIPRIRKVKIAPTKNRKNVLTGGELSYPAGVASRYRRQLAALVRQMTKEVTTGFLSLFHSPKAQKSLALDWSLASQARILGGKLAKKYELLFNDLAWILAQQLVDEASDVSAAAVAASIKKISSDLTIKTDFVTAGMEEIAKASVAENVALIRSIPEQYLLRVQGEVMRSITNAGGGIGELTKALEKYEGMTKTRAANIAEDQTRKVYTSINAKRLQRVGLDKFKWKYNFVGQKSRELHVEMDGNIYSFSDPPTIQENPLVKGLPGELPFCHCSVTPVVVFDDEEEK